MVGRLGDRKGACVRLRPNMQGTVKLKARCSESESQREAEREAHTQNVLLNPKLQLNPN